MKSRRLLTASGLGVALAMILAVAAPAQQVLVTLTNPTGSRTVYVEDILGNAMTSMDFGTGRMKPARIRVVDTDMSRTGFNVQASMSNLYLVSGSSYDYAQKIGSASVSVTYPAAALNVLNVNALVAPIFNGTLSAGAVCSLLGLLPSCLPGDLALSNLAGTLRNVTLPVNLSDLSKLPIVPQSGDAGSFTNPHYQGVGAGDPAKGSNPATQLRVISGGATTNLAGMISSVQSALSGAIAGLPTTQLVPQDTLIVAIKDAVKNALGTVLTDSQALSLVTSVTLTLNALTDNDILRQTGTYLSYPILNVAVPGTAAGGDYRGTLVVTAVQS